MLLLLLFGLLLLRFATRQLLALLFQLPPRFTRFDQLADPCPDILLQPAGLLPMFLNLGEIDKAFRSGSRTWSKALRIRWKKIAGDDVPPGF